MLHAVLPVLTASYLVSGQYPPSTILMLLTFLLGITGVKAVSLDPDLSSWPSIAVVLPLSFPLSSCPASS